MSVDIQVAARSKQIVDQTVARAFDANHKKNPAARRVLHYMLSLAASRGYRQGEAFYSYFRGDKARQTPQLTQRFVAQLLEFVSADEFAEFAERIRF